MSNCNLQNQIISLEEFYTYCGDYEDSPEVKFRKVQTLDSAQQIVEEYLGYQLLSTNHSEVFEGIEGRRVFLHFLPVQYVDEVKVNGKEILQDYGYVFDKESIYLDRFLKPCDKVFVAYTSGWNKNNVPPLIRQTILRIATLLYMEGGENIGVSSRSFSDQSRTFINYTNYSKYLHPLIGFKAVRL